MTSFCLTLQGVSTHRQFTLVHVSISTLKFLKVTSGACKSFIQVLILVLPFPYHQPCILPTSGSLLPALNPRHKMTFSQGSFHLNPYPKFTPDPLPSWTPLLECTPVQPHPVVSPAAMHQKELPLHSRGRAQETLAGNITEPKMVLAAWTVQYGMPQLLTGILAYIVGLPHLQIHPTWLGSNLLMI